MSQDRDNWRFTISNALSQIVGRCFSSWAPVACSRRPQLLAEIWATLSVFRSSRWWVYVCWLLECTQFNPTNIHRDFGRNYCFPLHGHLLRLTPRKVKRVYTCKVLTDYKTWGFHGGDYEGWRLLGFYGVWLL
jgi:hypothetical protein